MTNNVLYVSDGDYGAPAGYMLPLVQGQFGQSLPIEVRDLAGNVVNLTGYSTITAHKRKGASVTAWVGAVALSGTPSAAPQVTATVDEDDTGEDGVFSFFLEITNGTIAYTTHPVALVVVRDPAVNATAAAGLVGVTTAQKTLLASLMTLAGLANFSGSGSAAAIKINLSASAAPTTGDDTGDGYGVGSLWIDTTNDKAYICLDATLAAAVWTEITQSGGGAVSSVFGRTGAVVAAANDYAASEIEDDALLTASVGAALSQLDSQISGLQSGKQDVDSDLTTIAALTPANDDIIQRKAGAWTNRTVAQYKTDLGISGTMTGGGVLATGGFTLTVPATGTAALLATANVFTAAQQVSATNSSSSGYTITNNGAAADSVGVRGSAPTGMGVQGLTNSGVAIEGFLQAATSTSAVNTTLRLASRASGTPGAGFGTQILVRLETSTTNDVDTGRLAVLWNTATHASRVPDGVFYLTDSAAEREIWRGRANGSAAAIGFLGATPAAQQAHINDPSGGATTDAEARTAINSILDILQTFGLMAA